MSDKNRIRGINKKTANKRVNNHENDMTVYDWFFTTKKLPKELVEKEILKK